MLDCLIILCLLCLRPDILKALRLQKEKFDLARGSQVPKDLMDLILLSLYTSILPARALEIQTFFTETLITGPL